MLDVRELTQWNLRAVRTRNQDAAEGLWISPVLGGISHSHRESFAPFDRHRQRRLANGVLDHLLDVANPDAISGRRAAIHLNVQVLAARDLLRIHVAGAGHPANHVRNLTGDALEHPQIGAEDLHAHFRPYAGREHVYPVDDWHRPDV